MQQNLDYEINPKENFYFALKLIAALAGYAFIYWVISQAFSGSKGAAAFIPLIFYIGLILLYLFLRQGILTGYLKGNAIKVSEKQFPEIHQVVVEQSERLGLKYYPSVYILQSGGVLNAFAMRFFGSN